MISFRMPGYAVLAVLPSAAFAQSDVVTLEPYVVTAAHTQYATVVDIDPRAPAQPVPAHDGADVLKSVPGFSVIRKGGTDGDPVLRGSAGSRVGVQLDGECTFGGCGNRMDPPTAYVFPAAYDRVTVIKGPQTVLHGPGNAAGVVLFERDLHRLHAAESTYRASGTVASFGRVDGLVDAFAGTGLFQGRGTATYTRADDYEDGDGNRVHSTYERWSTNGSAAWTPSAQTAVELSAALSDGEAAYADRMMDGVLFDRRNVGLRFEHSPEGSAIRTVGARAYYNYVDHVMDNYSLRTFVPSMMMPGKSVSNPDRLTAGGRVQAEMAILGGVTMTAGADTQYNEHSVRNSSNQDSDPYGLKPRVKDAEFTQYGLFAEANVPLGQAARMVAGARLDKWRATDERSSVAVSMMSMLPNPTAGAERSEDLLSGFFRLERDLGGEDKPLTLYAGIGYVERFPDYWEMIKNESATSISAFGIEPERTAQADVGALYRSSRIDLSLSLFAADISDYILVQSAYSKASGMMGTRNATVSRNVDATTLGGEASLTWRITEHWRCDASVAYVRGENETDGLPLAQIPPLEGRLGLAYATPGWSVGGLLRAAAEQDRVAINQGNIVGQDIGPSRGFAVLSLNASKRLGEHLRLSAGIDNLLDRTYAEHISRAGSAIAGFPQTTRVNEPGRTLWLKLDAVF